MNVIHLIVIFHDDGIHVIKNASLFDLFYLDWHWNFLFTHGLEPPLKNATRNIRTCPGMAVNQTSFGVFYLQGIIPAEMVPDGPLQLPESKHGLHQAWRTDRMTTGQKSTGRIHRHFSVYIGCSRFNKWSSF